MRGRVVSAGFEAVVSLEVLPSPGSMGNGNPATTVEIETVIDTGFTGHLTLPPETVSSLGLSKRGFVEAELADGETTALDVYEARVLWHGQPQLIPIYETGSGPLIGMALLHGSKLEMEITGGGEVEIHPLA